MGKTNRRSWPSSLHTRSLQSSVPQVRARRPCWTNALWRSSPAAVAACCPPPSRLVVWLIALALTASGWPLTPAIAQAPQAAEMTQPAAPATGSLAEQQQQVAERFRRLEELLLRLADMEADNHPERAALLRRAARQGRDQFILDKLNQAATALRQSQYKNAIDTQDAARASLDQLLTLLLSEDRPQRLREEKERVAKMIKDLKVVERLQRSTRARTENGADLQTLSDEQQQINDRAARLDRQMQSTSQPSDAASDNESSSQPSADSSNDSPPRDDAAAQPDATDQPESVDGSKDADESNDADRSEGTEASEASKDGADAEAADSAESPDSTEGAGSSSSSDSSPPTPQQEAHQELQQAIEQMQQAAEELEQANRQPAIEQQRQAEEKLRAAIERLEKILRQLREEEMQRELARLESRVRKMAQMQTKQLESTEQLMAIPAAQRDRQVDIRAGNLSFEQKKIVMEADRALLLLREEGSSVAFPEVLVQIRSDMERVADRLASVQLDGVTTAIQEDILASLEEMLAALQQAQRDLEEQRQQEQQPAPPGQSSGDQQQPLIEQIAELKLIRSMETRILNSTQRYAETATDPDQADQMRQLIRELAQRQSSLYRITRDIVQKRNQ